MKKIGFFFVLVLLLAGCMQYTSNGEKQYLQSRNGVKVVVPPPLTDSNISSFYDLPQQNQSAIVSNVPPSNSELSQQAS